MNHEQGHWATHLHDVLVVDGDELHRVRVLLRTRVVVVVVVAQRVVVCKCRILLVVPILASLSILPLLLSLNFQVLCSHTE